MLVSSGLVMLMVPGLAFFYGGIVRRKNVLGTMMHSIVALSIVGVLWVVVGYALAFGTSTAGFIGWDPRLLGLKGVLSSDPFPNTKIPIFVHCMYQGMFAIITPALISGAVAERVRFGPYCLFIALWSLVVYCPLAHWVWAVDAKGAAAGWLGQFGALDFAGGTVVHIAAGFSGLAAIMVLRKRIGYPEHAMHPNSMVLTLFGAGLLWFGWFGFNGGSALGSNGLSGAALSATQVAAASAGLAWTLIEWFHRGKPTALGLATGIVAGLVAVTPASGYVTPLSALLIGIVASAVCYGMVFLKPLLKYDDSLDAFGVHGIGGLVGALLTGVLASMKLWQSGGGSGELGALGSAGDDILAQMKSQCLAAGVAMVFSFVVTIVLVKGIDLVFGFCLISEDEAMGLDYSAHGEVGFDFGLTGEMEVPMPEPRAAMVPPNGGRRFSVVVDGADDKSLMDVWSDLCQTSTSPPPSEFKAVYPYVTTVQGNRFRFRGGDPSLVSANLERLFQSRLDGKKIRTHLDV
jgi:ammonium transporter